MPTLGQVFDKVKESNNLLKDIRADVQTLTESNAEISQDIKQLLTRTQGVEDKIDHLRSEMNAGFFNMSTGLNDLIKLGAYHNILLSHQIEQSNSMICILEHISKAVCAIHNETHQQTKLQRGLQNDVNAIRDMAATLHSDANLDLKRRQELERKIEACCPPQPDRPICIYHPCPVPDTPSELPPSLEHKPLSSPPTPEG